MKNLVYDYVVVILWGTCGIVICIDAFIEQIVFLYLVAACCFFVMLPHIVVIKRVKRQLKKITEFYKETCEIFAVLDVLEMHGVTSYSLIYNAIDVIQFSFPQYKGQLTTSWEPDFVVFDADKPYKFYFSLAPGVVLDGVYAVSDEVSLEKRPLYKFRLSISALRGMSLSEKRCALCSFMSALEKPWYFGELE